mgnify:CR=1 FL=1
MDSIKTRIVNAPQMSGIQTLAFNRVDTNGTTVNDFAVSTGTTTSILIPENAYVVAGHIVCDTALGSHNVTNCWVLPGTVTSETYSSSGEKVVPVEVKVVVNTSAATAGKIYWWVEYAFLPNIVWDQNLLV